MNASVESRRPAPDAAALERALLPAVRRADSDTYVIADGYSCRAQIAQGTSRRALHLAEVVRLAMGSRPRMHHPAGITGIENGRRQTRIPP